MDHHTVSLKDGVVPLMAFDTETSGTDALTAHIITWGTSTADDPEHEVVLRLPEHVTELDEANVAVHGYSMDKIEELGGDRIEGLVAAFETLDQFNSTTNGFIVGHNVVYDMTILDAELRREGMADKAAKIDDWRVIDTLPLLESTDLIGMFKTVLKLNVIAETFGVEKSILDNAHNAAADSLVAAALFTQMIRFFPHLGGMTVAELNAYMRECAKQTQFKKQAIFKENRMGYPISRPFSKPTATATTVKKKSGPKKRPKKSESTTTAKRTTATRRRSTSRSSSRLRSK